MKAIEVEIALPGTQDFLHGQTVVVNGHSMVLGRDAGDLPFVAEFPVQPGTAMQQQAREGTPDRAEAEQREIDLQQFLSHRLSPSPAALEYGSLPPHFKALFGGTDLPALPFQIRDDFVYEIKCLPEILRRRTITDAQVMIHAEVVARHHQNTLFPEQPLDEHCRIDR